MSYISSSIGINVPQIIVAGIEDAIISKGNVKDSLLAGASVGVSNLLPAYGPAGMWGSGAEKYVAEPIVAGLLYALGSKYMKVGEKEGSFMKKFGKGFIIGASSAAVSGQVLSGTMATARVPSQYTTNAGGLRNTTTLPVSSTTASFVVS